MDGFEMEFLFTILFELVMAIFGGAIETALARTGKRFWMWFVGLALIIAVFWWRGLQVWSPYIFAILMLGFLFSLTMMASNRDK